MNYEIFLKNVNANRSNSIDDFEDSKHFGYAGTCKNLHDVMKVLREVIGGDAVAATVAFGMVLTAKLCADGMYRDDTLMVLNELSKTKMEFDIIKCHTFPTVSVTSHILSSAQRYADENTIPCTEWPVTNDIVNIVLEEAIKYSKVKEWKLSETDENNVCVGSYCVKEIGGRWVRIS